MKKIMLPLLACIYSMLAFGQHTFKATIRDSVTNEPLIGVTGMLKDAKIVGTSDVNGKIELKNIPYGNQTILFNYIGYAQLAIDYHFSPADTLKGWNVFMKPEAEELEEVIVSTTRTSRTIQNAPTRVEMIELEEIDEKSNMRPANVSMLLHESTGIQVQQTSATSANASIRMQGLDGRYTQLLKDGYPNFGNFASGLSILEIPPLDLQQVEIIKGPASPLYGGGAIAGVVNFISKTPKQEAEYNFIINQSNIGQTTLGAFASQQKNKFGYTFLGLANWQQAYDVDKDDFTELPESKDFSIHPKLFFPISKQSEIIIGNSFTMGERTGGDINVIKERGDSTHTYFERNNTLRNITTLEFSATTKNKNRVLAKLSHSIFNREIHLKDYTFKGANQLSFGDISYTLNGEKQVLIIGAGLVNDDFNETRLIAGQKRDFTSTTTGIYAQHTWDISQKISLESGLRNDIVHYRNENYTNTEYFLLPRVSALFKINNKLSSRIGGGLGYKSPTLFTEQTEGMQYRNVLPLNKVSSEKSSGATIDFNYKTPITNELYFTINQLFFYTVIRNSAVLRPDTTGAYFFNNTNSPTESRGFETNVKFIYKEHFKLFAGYTYTDAKSTHLIGNQTIPLLAKNKLNLALVYEKERDLKIGLEAYFTDRQYLNNGTRTPSFWELGAMAEKTIGKLAVYINFENFTDVRQSNYKRVVNEPHNAPTFDDIWTHTEGFVINGGIKIKL